VFEGEAGGYDPWMGRAEAILKDYEIIKERPLYRSIVVSIRQKIRGSAETTLLSYNVAEDDWPETKRVLMLHYADKRSAHAGIPDGANDSGGEDDRRVLLRNKCSFCPDNTLSQKW